jgi:hypothetical protein
MAALVVVAGVAACGDDSVDALSKDDYVAEANAICAATNDVVNAEFEEFFMTTFADLPDGANTPEEAHTVVEAMDAMFDGAITPSLEEQIAELRALGAPDGDADALTALYDDFDRALYAYNATLDDAVAGDEDAMEGIGSGSAEAIFDDVDQRARDYGLTECGAQDA